MSGVIAEPRSRLSRFLRPTLNWQFFLRLGLLAAAAFIIFGFFLKPCVIWGSSMEPTYGSFGFTLCVPHADAGERVTYGDIVAIRFQKRTYYLKRIIGLPGDTIEFKRGQLYRNQEPVDEPYVQNPCSWDLAPVTVPEGMVFAVGDNRSMRPQQHKFGLVDRNRIIGQPLW